MRIRLVLALVALCVASVTAQQTATGTAQKPPTPPAQTQGAGQPPKTQTPPKPQQAPAPASGSSRSTMYVFVTEPSGKPVVGAAVTVTGPVTREGTSDRDGVLRLTGLRSGTYRLRFEAGQYVTLERDVAVRGGVPTEVDAMLNPAPMPPPAPPLAPPPVAAPPPAPQEPVESVGRFAVIDLPDWIERNYLGRSDGLRENLVGEVKAGRASVLQIRDALKDRGRTDADELLYVVAGDGAVRVGGREESVTAGCLVVVPRGTRYSVERRGRNPLMVLQVVATGK